ncbi:MAG: molybdenum cofactor biosynthesis protein MoaE [Bryobacteraceae bacterium]
MRARVLFFGVLKDLVGRNSEDAEFAEGADLRAVLDRYAALSPAIGKMAGSIVVARNRAFAEPATKIAEGDEIALLPPVSGGSEQPVDGLEIEEGGNYFAITHRSLDARRLAARLLQGSEGAVVTFEGTVRNHTGGRRTLYLDYEGYEPMALRTMAEIGRELASAFALEHVAMAHRLGRLLVGETSVAVVVTAAHRRPAFEAALEGINRLKKRVPIWKKEHFADGEVWVEGAWDPDVPLAR